MFFSKKSPNGLNLAVSRSPNSWCLVSDENFLKSRWNMAYFVQNFPLIFFLDLVFWYLVLPTHKLAWNGSKSPKITSKTAISGKMVNFSKKRKWPWNWKLNFDSESAPSMTFYFFLFFYYFNTIGIRKYSRDALKLWLMAYFVQNFSLIIFSVSVFWYLVPPTHKLAKNSRKMVKMAIFDTFSLIYA